MNDKPGVYIDETGVHYRASKLGSCIRELVGLRKGLEPNPTSEKMQGYYDEGHDWEETIFNKFLDKIGRKNVVVRTGQQEINLRCGSYEGMDLWVTGHTDFEIVRQDIEETVEVKFLAKSSYRKMNWTWDEPLKNFPYYSWQRDGYMLARKRPMWYVIGLKERDEDGIAGLVDVIHHRVEHPRRNLVDFIRRLKAIEELSRSDDLPGCDFAQFPCPFYGTICASGELRNKQKEERGPAVLLPPDMQELFDTTCAKYEHGRVLEEEGKRKKIEAMHGFTGFLETMGIERDGEGLIKDGRGDLRGKLWAMQWISYNKKGGINWDKVPKKLRDELDQYREEGSRVEYPKLELPAIDAGIANLGRAVENSTDMIEKQKLQGMKEFIEEGSGKTVVTIKRKK